MAGQEDPWKRAWWPTPAFLPGESHGQRSLVGCSPWDFKETWLSVWHCTSLHQANYCIWVSGEVMGKTITPSIKTLSFYSGTNRGQWRMLWYLIVTIHVVKSGLLLKQRRLGLRNTGWWSWKQRDSLPFLICFIEV